MFIVANCYFSDLLIHQIQSGRGFNNEFISLNYTQNTGAAFSILHDYPFLLIALAVISGIVLLIVLKKRKKSLLQEIKVLIKSFRVK